MQHIEETKRIIKETLDKHIENYSFASSKRDEERTDYAVRMFLTSLIPDFASPNCVAEYFNYYNERKQ